MNVDGFSALNDEHDGEHNHHVSHILPWKAAQLTQENTFDMVCLLHTEFRHGEAGLTRKHFHNVNVGSYKTHQFLKLEHALPLGTAEEMHFFFFFTFPGTNLSPFRI